MIVNLNGGELLGRALDALARQTVRPARVIVVDNASTDGSAEALERRYPGVEIVQLDENIGFAAANNLVVRRADDCEWIALLNPDAFPEAAWLETLLDAAATDPGFSFFGSRLLRADDPEELDGAGDVYHVSGMAWRRGHRERADGAFLGREEVFSPCAAAALYRRDAFLSVGGFDESYFCYVEDTDLSFRLRLAGHQCLYVPQAVVHHVGSAIAGEQSDFTLYHSFRNLNWTFVKNMPRALFWLYLPQLLFINVLLLVALTLRRRPRIVLSAQWAAVRGLPRVLRQRRALQRARVARTSEIQHAMERGLGGYLTTFLRNFRRSVAGREGVGAGAVDERAVVVARNVITNFGAQAWILVLSLVATPYLVGALGVDAFGVYALVLTLIGYFAFLDLGLGVATVKYLSEYVGRDDRDGIERTLRTAIGAYLVIGAVGASVIALSASVIVDSLLNVPSGLGELAKTAILLAGAGFAINMPLAVLGAVPAAVQRLDLANALNVVFATVNVGGGIALLAAGFDLTAVLAYSAAISIVALATFLALGRRLLPGVSFLPRLDRDSLRLLMGFGGLKFANQMSVQTVYHLDKFLVGALVSVGAVTFYVIPVAIAQRLTSLVANVVVAFLPAASELHARGDRPRFEELYFRAAKSVALVILPIGVVLVIFAEPILSVWLGADFAARSAWPLRLLAAGYTVSAMGTIPAVTCDAVGRPGVTTAFSIAGAVVNISLALILIPRYGLVGAASVILVHASVSLPVFLTFVHRRVVRLPISALLRRSLMRPIAAVALGSVPMIVLAPLAGGLVSLVLVVGFCLAAYVGFAIAVGAYDPVDRNVSLRAFRRRAAAADAGS